MRVGIIGAVGTTKLTLEKLIEHGFIIVGVLGHEPKNKLSVSGIQNLRGIAEKHNIDYQAYTRINEEELIDWMKAKEPDIIFAVGFSQLLKTAWLNLAPKGCVGFHPTQLPEGRGRAPIAWLLLEQRNGAASFFQMGDGVDDGAIFVQEPFEVSEEDDAETLIPKVQQAISKALDRWLPDLKVGHFNPEEQCHDLATEYGKRDPADGQINWFESAKKIDRLIKASCRPHPGAFSSIEGEIIKIWKSKALDHLKIKGKEGRVLDVNPSGIIVQCGEGYLLIEECSSKGNVTPQVGDTFENFFYSSRKEFNQLILKS